MEQQHEYVSYFLNSALASGSPLAALSLLLLYMARMFPIIALCPFFGGRVLPHPVKIALALCLFAIFLPHLLFVTESTLKYDTYLIVLLAKELTIGFIMGFLMSLPFSIVQSAGIMIDHQRGGASLMVNDPTIQEQSSPLGTLFNFVLIYLFFLIDGPFLFIEAILNSYVMVPPDKMINPNFFAADTTSWKMTIGLLNHVMILSIQLASPALIMILMTDLFLGIVNRLAPQVQITFLGLPLKSLLGLTVVTLGWSLFAKQISHEAYRWVFSIVEYIQYFKTPT